MAEKKVAEVKGYETDDINMRNQYEGMGFHVVETKNVVKDNKVKEVFTFLETPKEIVAGTPGVSLTKVSPGEVKKNIAKKKALKRKNRR